MAICSGCGRTIKWGVTPAGKPMPLDMEPDAEREVGSYAVRGTGTKPNAIPVKYAMPGETVYPSHWSTCPKAGQFRKAGGRS